MPLLAEVMAPLKYDLKVEIYEEWLQPSNYVNDRYIMDTAIADKHFQRKPWKQEIINNCRLYLKIYTLGEITKNGIDIM